MATYYAINAGGNWSAGGTWSTVATKSAARTGGATQPTNADTCILDDYSGNVTVDTTTCVCKILNCTTNGNYAGTLTFTSVKILGISTAGSVVFASTMILAGTGKLNVIGTCSITSAGLTFPGALTFTTSGTKTLVDNLTVTGLFTSATSTQTVNKTGAGAGDTLTLNGGLFVIGNLTGTTNIVFAGGVWSHNSSTTVANNLTFAGNVTITGIVYYTTRILTYTSGTVTVTNSQLRLSGSATLDCGGMTFNRVTITRDCYVLTLSSDLHCVTLYVEPEQEYWNDVVGAFDIYCDNFYYYCITTYPQFRITSGQHLYISTKMQMIANTTDVTLIFPEIKSITSSSPIYLDYAGTPANCFVAGAIFTDVDASGSAQRIDNWYGGTLTRTTNIYNRMGADIGSGQNVFGVI